MADQVTAILTNSLSPDMAIRTEAERQLEAAKETNFAMFMVRRPPSLRKLGTNGAPRVFWGRPRRGGQAAGRRVGRVLARASVVCPAGPKAQTTANAATAARCRNRGCHWGEIFFCPVTCAACCVHDVSQRAHMYICIVSRQLRALIGGV